MRKPRSVVGIWRDAKEVLTKQASLGNEPQASCRNSRSGRETRKYAGVSGFLPARRLRELSRSLRVASAYVSGEPNDRVQMNEASAVGDDETPWPGQKSRRVVYRYYRAAGSGSAPSPRRNDSERPLTQAATRRDSTHVAQIARRSRVYACICTRTRIHAYTLTRRALLHVHGTHVNPRRVFALTLACVYPSAKGRRTGRRRRRR
ncbi:hypothetical protein ALC53_07814 [Atta colombica]|uniref:Uncharacterized protein n=1 Tax=Atta colombica TaxID=520822 RepID=A0A195BC98_9HYME|nr:hypothetical protein ALC53_07814 [Atta colombica]